MNLSERVKKHLDANPGQSFTARTLSAALHASSYSIAMACRWLIAHDMIETRPGPLRFYQSKPTTAHGAGAP